MRLTDSVGHNDLNFQIKTPMILRGARQVGKSFLVRQLAKKHNLTLAEVNFELQPKFASIFNNPDPAYIVPKLEEALDVRISSGTLLFLDEVQICTEAITALRYFYEKRKEIPIIAAGSLLEFALSDLKSPMPVGRVSFRWLTPLSFREYLNARKLEILQEAIQKFVSKKEVISEIVHERLLSELAVYACVGGMPEAMKRALVGGKALVSEAALVHNDILLSYRSDFYKYRGRLPVESLNAILDAMPQIVGQTKVKYTSISRDIRSASLKSALDALDKAGVMKRVCASAAQAIPLSAGENRENYKILPLDVGLFISQSFLGSHTQRPVANLFDKWTQGDVFEKKWLGQIAETLVGQALHYHSQGQHLYYWMRDARGAEAEVDYLTQVGTQIVPIEVKAGSSGTLRSLHVLMAEKSLKKALRFDLNLPSIQDIDMNIPTTGEKMKRAKYKLFNLPLYLADWMFELLEKI